MADPSPLTVERYGRRYARRRPWALRGVSVDIRAGSIVALVGPNGAGKSTLVRACLGFEPADEGRVIVCGHDPGRDRAGAVASVGYVPQQSSLYRGLTIGDHLTMARANRRGFDRVHAARRIEAAGLSEDRKVGELSGGEQAQVGLALALGTRAPLLLLDEPLANLDPLARRHFLTALVADVRPRAATAVLSSHVVTDVEQACDWLIVLGRGRLLLAGPISLLKADFRIVAARDVDGGVAIGSFPGPAGELLTLLRQSTKGRPASLEEVVLGHIAADLPSAAEAA